MEAPHLECQQTLVDLGTFQAGVLVNVANVSTALTASKVNKGQLWRKAWQSARKWSKWGHGGNNNGGAAHLPHHAACCKAAHLEPQDGVAATRVRIDICGACAPSLVAFGKQLQQLLCRDHVALHEANNLHIHVAILTKYQLGAVGQQVELGGGCSKQQHAESVSANSAMAGQCTCTLLRTTLDM